MFACFQEAKGGEKEPLEDHEDDKDPRCFEFFFVFAPFCEQNMRLENLVLRAIR